METSKNMKCGQKKVCVNKSLTRNELRQKWLRKIDMYTRIVVKIVMFVERIVLLVFALFVKSFIFVSTYSILKHIKIV